MEPRSPGARSLLRTNGLTDGDLDFVTDPLTACSACPLLVRALPAWHTQPPHLWTTQWGKYILLPFPPPENHEGKYWPWHLHRLPPLQLNHPAVLKWKKGSRCLTAVGLQFPICLCVSGISKGRQVAEHCRTQILRVPILWELQFNASETGQAQINTDQNTVCTEYTAGKSEAFKKNRFCPLS